MARRWNVFALQLLAFALVATSASVVAEPDEPENPCAGEFTDPALTDCWDCYIHMLADCDANNPSGPRREACYKAAHTFYEWCLGRIPKQADHKGVFDEREREHTVVRLLAFDVRKHIAFDFDFGGKVDAADVRVFVRTLESKEGTEERPVMHALAMDEFWPLQGNDGLRIVLDSDAMRDHLHAAASLVVALADKDDQIRWGLAMPLELEDSYDLDGDGVYTKSDRRIALRRWMDKEMSTEVVSAMYSAPLDED